MSALNTFDSPTRGPRLRDEAALFNPAFVAALIASGAAAHEKEYARRLPLEIAMLLPLLTVPGRVRRLLPGSVRPFLINWLDENPSVRPVVQQAAPAYAPVTRRGLRFGLRHDLVDLDALGLASAPALARVRKVADLPVQEVLDKAALVARWLPRAGSTATIYNSLGVRP